MTELSQNERDERLARLAARGRVTRPTTEPTTGEPRVAANRRPAPTSGRAKHPAGRSRILTGIMSAALALGIVSGLAAGGHQVAQAAAPSTQPVVVVPTSGSSGTTTRSVSTPAPATATPAPATTSGGS